MRHYVFNCRTLVDAILAGDRDPADVIRACAACKRPVLLTHYGQAKEATARRERHECFFLCNACALDVVRARRAAGDTDTQIETSPAAVEATESSPNAKKQLDELLKAILP